MDNTLHLLGIGADLCPRPQPRPMQRIGDLFLCDGEISHVKGVPVGDAYISRGVCAGLVAFNAILWHPCPLDRAVFNPLDEDSITLPLNDCYPMQWDDGVGRLIGYDYRL